MTSPAVSLRRLAFLGNHPPRVCGLATFTGDLRAAVASAAPDAECFALAMTDGPRGSYDFPQEVRLEIPDDDPGAYSRAGGLLNDMNVDVLCLQHEYGIFGGVDGVHVLALLEQARMPVVVTLHTVLDKPTPGQFGVMSEIIRRAARLVVMTQRSLEILASVHGVPEDQVTVIPHGIPDTPFFDPNYHKDEFDAAGRTVLLTFGLLSPGKGIEHAIRAMPAIVERRPDALYIVLGATHPNLRRQEGEQHREALIRLAAELGVSDHVRFLEHFVDLPTLTRAIGAADIYLTPYLNEAQSVSGTLAYSFGMGKPVVSTPYWHAAELLANERGVLVPFADPGAIAEAAIGLLEDQPRMHAMRKAAYEIGRDMVWPRIGERYLEVFREARLGTSQRRQPLRRLPAGGSGVTLGAERKVEAAEPSLLVAAPGTGVGNAGDALPRLDHLARLLDSTGIAQHATHAVVDRTHGYCLDDNARGLMLSALLTGDDGSGNTAFVDNLFDRTAAFVQHAWNGDVVRFRNFMGYDRRWLEEAGSDDSHGRAVWALGLVAARTAVPWRRAWAYGLFERVAEPVSAFTSPRALAFGLLGAVEYLWKQPEDRRFNRLRAHLADGLRDRLRIIRRPGWIWFEDVASYDNARLAQALIVAGHQAERADWLAEGLEALEWLCGVQRAEAGHFRPIGSDAAWRPNTEREKFDQQPLEAGATVSACIAAWRATQNLLWLSEARRASEWFLGNNDLGEPLYDAETGGCYDGLLCDRINSNQGAESTLAFFLAMVEMRNAPTNVIRKPLSGNGRGWIGEHRTQSVASAADHNTARPSTGSRPPFLAGG